MKTFFVVLVTFYATATFAQKIDGEVELAGFLSVDKFFDSNVISEIILKPHAGKWKVAEIKFR